MTYKEFNKFCRALTATTYVMQWGGSHVWKVGGKVFAIGGWQDDEASFTFKVSDISYEMLKEQPGLRPAPYLASRGMKWIQHFAKPGLSDGALRDYIRTSSSRRAYRRRNGSNLDLVPDPKAYVAQASSTATDCFRNPQRPLNLRRGNRSSCH